jgi:hypothetical protein
VLADARHHAERELHGGCNKLVGGHSKIADQLALPGLDDADWALPDSRELARSAELS